VPHSVGHHSARQCFAGRASVRLWTALALALDDFEALRLAPPVLESRATGGRLLSRAVVDFDLEWSLPAADGA